MRKQYDCSVIGVSDEGRAAYILQNVSRGDAIELLRDPANLRGPEAIAANHHGRMIGFLHTRDDWIWNYFAKAEDHDVHVDELYLDDRGELAALDITVDLDLPDPPEPPPSIVNQIGPELRLLMTIAMADGRFQAKEREILEQFADVRARELGVTPEDGEAIRAIRWARRRVPDSFESAQIVGRLAIDRPAAFDSILEVADIVAEMDGKILDVEKAKVALLRELIAYGRTAAAVT